MNLYCVLSSLVASCIFIWSVGGAEPPIAAVAFAPGGESVAAVSQAGLQVFSWPDLQLRTTIEASPANLHCVAFSPQGNQLAVGGGNPSEQGSVQVFSWPAGDPIAILREHEDSVMAISWRDASHLFSASLDRDINLYDLEQRKLLLTYKGHSRGVSTLCLLKDGKTLVSAGLDQSVRVWNSSSGEVIRSLSQHTKRIHAVALRPAESGLPMIASASSDRTIRFWQPTIGRMIRYVRLKSEPLNIAWTSDGRQILATCVDGHVRVIDPDEVKVVQDLPAVDGWAYSTAVHPTDGSAVVGGAHGQLRRIELSR